MTRGVIGRRLPRWPRTKSRGRRAVLLVGALGVVFGDIGTSPLYAMQTVFSPDALRPVPVEETAIYGAISLVFWSITVIVTVMYVLTFMRTDNDGEGGLLALLALLAESRLSTKAFGILASVGIFGAALFFGDSMITPAISVLSSMEGLEILDPGLKEIVVPGAVGILLALFAVQRWGTARVGRFFGPVMALWFLAIAACGVPEIVRHPDVLQALSPHWAVRFFLEEPLIAFLALGGVVLAITGAEALYADMGHFGRKPISHSWLAIVFPALTLNYLGQGALLVNDAVGGPQPVLPARARLGADADGGAGHGGHRDRLAGGDLGRLLGRPTRPPGWASCRACGWCTPPRASRARSTCRSSTGC